MNLTPIKIRCDMRYLRIAHKSESAAILIAD